MRRLTDLLVLLTAALLLAACAAPAPTPTPTPPPSPTPQPTATPQPPTASPTPTAAFTPSPTPDILLMKTRRLLTAFAASVEETPDGGYLLTLPSGEKVELQNVAEQNLIMEPQNWVENYNHGHILYEGQTQTGQTWRVVELETGEIALMWAQKTKVRMDAFPYWWWGLGAEGKAEVTVPGNGELQWLKVTRTDNRDDKGHYVWVDEEGNPVKLSELGYMYVEKIMPKQGKPMPMEMKLPVVELTDWQVQAVEANDGHEYVVREGKVWVDGKAAPVPETKSQVSPENLMLNTKDGQWYVGWRGIALWKVEDGQVIKYDRPVWFTNLWRQDTWDYRVTNEKWASDPRVTGEISYKGWQFIIDKQEALEYGMWSGIQSETWSNKCMYVFSGFVVGVDVGETAELFGLRLIQPFNDNVFTFHVDRSDNIWVVSEDGGIERSKRINSHESLADVVLSGKNIPAVVVIINDGDNFMGAKRADGSRWMSTEEALKLRQELEQKLSAGGYLGDNTKAMLGWPQKLYVPAEILK